MTSDAILSLVICHILLPSLHTTRIPNLKFLIRGKWWWNKPNGDFAAQ